VVLTTASPSDIRRSVRQQDKVCTKRNDLFFVADTLSREWDMNTGKIISVMEGHTGGVKCIQHDPVSSRLLSGSDDKTVKIYDTRVGKSVSMLLSSCIDTNYCNQAMHQ